MLVWQGARSQWATGTWKMIPIESVVDTIVDRIEQGRDIVIAPAQKTLIARPPGLFLRAVERLGCN